ncbi:MAG: NAD(P)-binding protein [Clostridia bacterium]|nr:NAD(P)-binding protein [Clostridia bacterium]MBQ8599798.1 NAD(P)-binding protein [Clostridia bacterium]
MQVKHLIIGAGISGLTFANYCDDYLILEKEPEVGGYCRTIKQNGFVWDYAGHFFHFKTREFKERFVDEVPAEDIIVQEKCTKIYYKGELIDYPFQTNIHQLPKEEFIDCLYDLFNKTEKEEYDHFLDMLYGKFGKSITEKFLKPYNEKLYATDLTALDKNAMGRFFPYADKEAIINNMKASRDTSYNNSFLYPKDGADTFIKILASKLDPARILLNDGLASLDLENRVAVTESGKKIRFEKLINTMPLNLLLPMIGEETLAEELSYNQVLVFNLGFNKKSPLTEEHWLYIPDKTCNYYRIGFYDNILSQDRLSMYIEIGYPRNATITQEEIDRQLQRTLENLQKQGVTDAETKLTDYVSIVMNPAYVHINGNTDRKIKNLFADLAAQGIYSIGRYGGWTYCSMEDCMLEARDLAKSIS